MPCGLRGPHYASARLRSASMTRGFRALLTGTSFLIRTGADLLLTHGARQASTEPPPCNGWSHSPTPDKTHRGPVLHRPLRRIGAGGVAIGIRPAHLVAGARPRSTPAEPALLSPT